MMDCFEYEVERLNPLHITPTALTRRVVRRLTLAISFFLVRSVSSVCDARKKKRARADVRNRVNKTSLVQPEKKRTNRARHTTIQGTASVNQKKTLFTVRPGICVALPFLDVHTRARAFPQDTATDDRGSHQETEDRSITPTGLVVARI